MAENPRSGLRRRIVRTGGNSLPLLIAIGGWCVTLLLCRVTLSRERAHMAGTAALAARNIQGKITSTVNERVAPLEALVVRWGADTDPWQAEWEAEARQLLEKYSEFESITWVDAGYRARWAIPAASDAALPARESFAAARQARKTIIASAGRGATASRLLRLLIPVFHHEKFEGCVVAVLRTGQWLQAVVDGEILQGYGASVSDRNEPIYVRNAASPSEVPPYNFQAPVNVYGAPWLVQVWPTRDEWTGSSRILSVLSLAIGLLLYVSGALAVAARRRTREVQWAKHKMATQQQNLRQANERLETVIQASPFAIVAMDLEGNVQSWNKASERIFGWRREEVIGRPPLYVPPEHMGEFREKIDCTVRGEPFSGLERRRLRKDGTPLNVAVWTAPLRDSAGSACGILTAIADISDKKKLEEQLQHSQKMEAVGRLAGGVAHDFNNLLTIINGYGHMMLKSLHSGDRLHAQAEQILKAGNQAAALTTQLLAFSRRQIIQPKPVDLNYIITDIEKMLRRIIGEDIVVRTALNPMLYLVKADPNQMGQVLINLASNARDAMPRGGTLTITTENVTLSEHLGRELADIPAGSYVKLTVTDTGEGMDAETMSHLFEPFFTTKERGKGTGLGLSSVYGSVRQNAGGISVWSERGKGTAFSIYLAQLPEPAVIEEEPGVAPAGVCRGSETILLVEDEVPLRNMLREALVNAGYRVREAGDGADALRKWQADAHSIDLLLTDVVMPFLNGRELAERLLSRSPRMQVIYMSGYAEDVAASHGILMAGTNFIQKPFLPDALMAKVRAVLNARGQVEFPAPAAKQQSKAAP